jgi:inorganic pyrophosphatase
MKVVTAGGAYIDIDAYAGCIAYVELLRLQGEEACAATSAPLNNSITSSVLAWGDHIKTDYTPADTDEFILVDISELTYCDPIVEEDRVIEVIDHHLGFEDYWRKKIGTGANIEFIGAACTLIYELWVKADMINQISQTSARLLATGILDNTLNFKATITTDRDTAAYEHLLKFANLPVDWPRQYFSECQDTIEANLPLALKNDMKFFYDNEHLPDVVAQLVVWDARNLLQNEKDKLIYEMNKLAPEWAINIISLDEGCSYFVSDNTSTQKKLSDLLDVKYNDDIMAKANRLWLRKEIVKRTLDNKLLQ